MGRMKAVVTYTDPTDGSEQIKLEDHEFQFGGIGDGFCYGHQSFDCLDNLTQEEQEALNWSDEFDHESIE